MAIDSYANLKDAIEGWLGSSPGLVDRIDDFIDIAESRFRRELRFREILVHDETNYDISDGDRYLDLTADFQAANTFRVLVPLNSLSGDRYFPSLEQKSPYELTQLATNHERRPSCFCVHTRIELDAEADRDYDAEFFYYKKLTALDDSQTSNELLARAPDMYLWGSLAAAQTFLFNDERIPVWNQLYLDAKEELRLQEVQANSAGPQRSRAAGTPPDVRGYRR